MFIDRRLFSTSIKRNLANIPGWRTKRKLLILESDDWGSIRMPSTKVFDNLEKNGIDFSADEGYIFNKYDSLATYEDLSLLFEVLSSVKDLNGEPAVMTPVSVVANPDFRRIKESGFKEYYFEPFTETLKQYKGCENAFILWKEGLEKRLFVPQFHGREHLNVKVWMRSLISGNKKTLLAFNNGMWGVSTAGDSDIRIEVQAAFDFLDPEDISNHKHVITTGLNLFEHLYGYRAIFFVPPNGPFSSKLEEGCFEAGVRYLSTSKIFYEPLGQGKTSKKLHWLGQKSKSGLTYLTRNCFFEPAKPGKDWIDSCMADISTSFMCKKPAVISTHRVNYIGALHKENRENGLRNLQLLLKNIIKKWPDVEFITSAELGDIISNE